MKVRRLWAVARKELLHVLRDPRSLALGIAIPVLLLVLFGYALTLDVDEVPLAVWDQSRTAASRELVSRFDGSRFFALDAPASGYADLEGRIDRGEILASLVIPSDFARELGASGTARAQLIVDGSDANTATLTIGYAEAVVRAYSEDVTLARLARLRGAGVRVPLRVEPRIWFNADLESRNTIVPGLIAVIMMVIAALLTSLTVAREWERGTMEQLLSTPVRKTELIVGKLLPYFGIGMLDVAIAVVMAEVLFHVPLRGSVALVFGAAAVFLAGSLALGMVISIVTRSQLLASQLAMVLTFLPSFLLSGFMYEIGNMPRPVQLVTHLVPARYFVTLLEGIYLKGVGLEVLAPEAVLLTLFAIAMMGLAHGTFRRQLT